MVSSKLKYNAFIHNRCIAGSKTFYLQDQGQGFDPEDQGKGQIESEDLHGGNTYCKWSAAVPSSMRDLICEQVWFRKELVYTVIKTS